MSRVNMKLKKSDWNSKYFINIKGKERIWGIWEKNKEEIMIEL